MATKEKKGAKFGRNTRAPTNAMQERRTERNKRVNAERAHAAKIQQMHGGQKTHDVYGHVPKINAAEKFVRACMHLWQMRLARTKVES
jgi:hypothetical protein